MSSTSESARKMTGRLFEGHVPRISIMVQAELQQSEQERDLLVASQVASVLYLHVSCVVA